MRAPAFWYLPHPNLAALALAPIGGVYGAIAARRMAQPGARVAAPVICVGNFVAGGGGKTPAAMAIGRLLLEMGERVAFVSRGYGGAGRAKSVAVDADLHSASEVGDEPLLLARVAPCFVAADRRAAAATAIRAGASVLVLDDGLQNPSLAKDLTFGMIDAGAGLGNGLCLPAGPLRAPLSAQLPHVSAIVRVGESRAGDPLFGGKPTLTARLIPDPDAARALAGRNVLAFAGIARPEKFYATLHGIGVKLAAVRSFGDHHLFSEEEIADLRAQAKAEGLVLATTQKDAARLSEEQREGVFALPVTLVFDDEKRVAIMLTDAIRRRRDNG
jgi:tetraacyldisaccharide 4'-kinase